MKRTKLVVLLVTLCLSSFGQKIHFSDSTNIWNYWYVSTGIIPAFVYSYTDHYTGDTVIKSEHYRQLWNNSIYRKAFIREDIAGKRVFIIMPLPPFNDTLEQLLYDYTLNVGDTFKNLTDTYYVNNVDSVIINSTWHRVWNFQHFSSGLPLSYSFDVIEGIGCTANPCFPVMPIPGTIEGGYMLTCFSSDGSSPPLNKKIGPSFDNSTSCSYDPLRSTHILTSKKDIAVFPNPITEATKIAIPYTISSGSIVIFDDIGHTILNTTFQNKDELLIGDKINTSGIYFYRVTDNQSWSVFSGKFMNR